MITILAADGTSLYESPSVERVLGWKPEELVGRPSFALLHEDDLEHVKKTFAAILAGEEPGPIEFRLRHRDGSWRTVEAIGRRRRQDGEWVVVVNYRDVTDERQLQEQLLHSQKLEAVGRLAGGIAHDFNNLLTAIGGYSQFLAAGFDDDDPRREDALEIVRASDRAAALTGQLLAFSRRQVLLAEVLDLGEVVGGLESLLSRLLGEGVELSTSVEPGCLVRADRGQLEQVITNLALNARDAMPVGRHGGARRALPRRRGRADRRATAASAWMPRRSRTPSSRSSPRRTRGRARGSASRPSTGSSRSRAARSRSTPGPARGRPSASSCRCRPMLAAVPVVREERAAERDRHRGRAARRGRGDDPPARRRGAGAQRLQGLRRVERRRGAPPARGARRRDRPAAHRRRHARDERPRPRPRGVEAQALAARPLHLGLHERAGRGVRRSGRRVHRQALLAPGARRQGARRARRAASSPRRRAR